MHRFRLPFTKLVLTGVFSWTLLVSSCAADLSVTAEPEEVPPLDRRDLAHGADLGWTTWLESRGVNWVDAAGRITPPETLLVERGFDSVRLRVMVSPQASTGVGFTDTASVVSAARRFATAGLRRVLVDFHLSDTWADPGHQAVPAAWAGHTAAVLAGDVASHVTAVLTALRDAGVTPEWVQIGNEIASGALWPNLDKVTGSSHWGPLAEVLNSGYGAVKAFDPTIQVIVHFGGFDVAPWWLTNFQAAGGLFDVIGLSYYPFWSPRDTVEMLRYSLVSLVSTYGTPVMVVEVGGPETDPAGTRLLLSQVKDAVASVPDGQGLGVFYWEPEGNSAVNGGYGLGATTVYGGKSLQFTDAMSGLGYSGP